MAVWSFAPSAVSATATGRATRTAPSPDRKSAKPNGLLKVPWIACATEVLIDIAKAPPVEKFACATAPCACLSNRVTRLGSKPGCSDCSANWLVQAKLPDAALKKPKASGPVCTPTWVTASDVGWNNRLWPAPLVQPPAPFGPITPGIHPNHIAQRAIS